MERNLIPAYVLSFPQRFAYGIGHVLNDLCASMWFTYLLVFLHYVLEFSNEMAGYLMLIGQLADGIATPLVGLELDRSNGCCGYTKRKSWHLLGTICVACSFPFLFMQVIGSPHASMWAQFIYYAPLIVIFQFGWATTQISHLSLIPELTPCKCERTELNAIRYAFTVISNLIVYVVTWLLLGTDATDGTSADLTPDNAGLFRTLALSMVGLGLTFSIFFHVVVKEKRTAAPINGSASGIVDSSEVDVCDRMTTSKWLKENQFYQVAVLYMATRLVVNVSQIYLPFYLTDSLKMDKQFIAIIPLVVYISGFLTSFVIRPINMCLGRKITYLLGAACIIGADIWILFLDHELQLWIFGPAALIGIGGSTLLVTSLCITADLIGEHTGSGAFVYGAMSFTDKLSNGLAVLAIQNLHPCKTSYCCPACVWYYREVMAYGPGSMAIVGVIALLTLMPMTIGSLRSHKKQAEKQKVDTEAEVNERTPLIQNDTPVGSIGATPEVEVEDSPGCCSYWCCVVSNKEAESQALACECDPHNCSHREHVRTPQLSRKSEEQEIHKELYRSISQHSSLPSTPIETAAIHHEPPSESPQLSRQGSHTTSPVFSPQLLVPDRANTPMQMCASAAPESQGDPVVT